MMEHAPIFIVITPIIGAFILSVFSRLITNQHIRDTIALISLCIPVILLFYFTPSFLISPIKYEIGGWPAPFGISLVLDSLSATLATIVGIVTLTSFVYSLEVREILPKGDEYYFLFLFMTTGLYGVFLTGDVINRYVFFELTIITTYVLLTYTGSKESLRASFNYLILGSIASFFFLIGIGILYFNTGFLDFHALGKIVPALPDSHKNIIFSFFLIAVGLKAGLIPFHTWLPDAHVSAPDPITAILAGITVKTGIYILIKFMAIGFLTPFIKTVFIALGLFTALVASYISLTYWNIKNILAWQTISQMGIITAVFAIWTPLSSISGIYHLVSHAIFKTLLFLSIGGFSFLYGTRDIRKIPILSSDPIIAGGFIIGTISIIGIPPLNGFYSKSLILTTFETSAVLYTLFLIIHFLTCLCFFRVIYYSKRASKPTHNKYVPTSILMPTAVLSGLSVFIGSTSSIWIDNIITPAANILITKNSLLNFGLIEFELIFSIHSFFLILLAGLVVFSVPIIQELKSSFFILNKFLHNTLSDVSIPQAVRYMIIVLAIYLLFTLI